MIASERHQEVNSVLNAADALARDGRRLDAIDVVTAANRTGHDPRLEQRLVYLRHNAFADLAPAPGLAVWPPSPPDLFAGTSGLPEVWAAICLRTLWPAASFATAACSCAASSDHRPWRA